MKYLFKFDSFNESLIREFSSDNQKYSTDTIKSIQQKLIDNKLLEPKNKKGKDNVDGIFGKLTKKALEQYQEKNSFSDKSGKITKETLDSMGIKVDMLTQSDLKSSTTSSEIEQQKGSKPDTKSQPVGNYGKFTPAKDKSAPLVVVFGGIPVGGRQSGDYMYDYFNKTGDKYNLFVAKSHKVNGLEAYQSLKSKISSGEITPSKKILYLFSGGYRPGMTLLSKFKAEEFDKIILVDIWMGNSSVAQFYKELASNNKEKVEYYYTDYGANNPSARNSISSSVSKKEKASAHMATNINAIKSLLEMG
jgi:hypothetical protein